VKVNDPSWAGREEKQGKNGKRGLKGGLEPLKRIARREKKKTSFVENRSVKQGNK